MEIDPFDGCLPDETGIRIQGIEGGICSAKCKFGTCPKDVPSGSTAHPQCALQSPTGEQYCALICLPGDSCGDSRASCKPVQGGIGICTYDS